MASKAIQNNIYKERVKKIIKERSASQITLQSLKILGVSVGKFRRLSAISAVVGFFVWYLVTLNILAALIMAALAYQIPGIWYEQKASDALNTLQKQISGFVGSFNDIFFSDRSMTDALKTAAKAVKGDPMEKHTSLFLRQLNAGVSESVALDTLADGVNHQSFRFFADLAKSVKDSGNKSKGFEELAWKFQEEESIQVEVKGEIFMYLAFTIVMGVLDPAVIVIYRLFYPEIFQYIPTHLPLVLIFGAIGSVIVFAAIRKFSRLRVTI